MSNIRYTPIIISFRPIIIQVHFYLFIAHTKKTIDKTIVFSCN